MVLSNLPRQYVDDPIDRQTKPYGLFDVIPPTTPPGSHWLAGVEYQPLCGGGGTTIDFCVTGSAPASKVETGDRTMRGAQPFTVYAEIDCSPQADVWDTQIARVTRMLMENEQFIAEKALWDGRAANLDIVYPHLAANTAVVDTRNAFAVTLQTAAVQVSGSNPAAPARALGLLEQAGYQCYTAGMGLIHAQLIAIPSLVNQGMLYRDGSQLRTINGSTIVAGAGYQNTGPDGTAAPPNTAWLYFTGQMFIYRGAIRTFQREESLDRNVNTLKAIAERTYVMGWDCCHFAVLVSI